MAGINGTLILVKGDGTAFALTKSCTLNINRATPDASTKSSNGWAEHIDGQKDWSIDLDGLADFQTSSSVDDLVDYIINQTSFINIEFVPIASGVKHVSYTGEASLTNVQIVAQMEEVATLSGSFKGTGELTKTVVS